MKTESGCYSIDDLKKDRVTAWSGVRNYQARNFMHDMNKGDLIFIYHSNTEPIGIVGIAKVSKEAYPDHTAQDKKDEHYDPKATTAKPIWNMVDVRFVKKFPQCITLAELKTHKKLKNMRILQKGNRLSITPVTKSEFTHIEKVAQR